MNYSDILSFITQNPICSLATSTNEQPHVRAFLTNIIDEKFYFTTSSQKNVGQEIKANQKSELCYVTPDFSKMLRVTATLKIVDDKKIKQHLIETRDYLKTFSAEDPTFILFTLENAKARFWTITDNMHEDELEVIGF